MFDVAAARKSGYSDDEIADFLSQQAGFDLAGAKKAGYSSAEIVSGLSAELGKQKPLPADVQPSQAGGGRGIAEEDPRRTDVVQDKGLGGTLSDSLARGVPSLMQGFSGTALRANSGILDSIDAVEQKLRAGKNPNTFTGDEDPYGVALMTSEQRLKFRAEANQSAGGNAASIAAAEATKAEYPAPRVVQKVMGAKTFGDAISEFVKEPAKFIAAIGPESLVSSAPGIAGAALVPGGVGVKAAMMGAGSGVTDYGSQIIEGLQRAGVDITDPEQVKAAAGDAQLMREIARQAMAHAGPVATFDASSGGVASKLAMPKAMATRLAAKPLAREVLSVAGQVPVQGAMGGAGEALGELAAGQPLDPGNILAEVVGEGFGAPAEIAGVAHQAVRERMHAAGPAPAVTNFTEPDSPAAKAGLTPVVVPIPTAAPMVEENPNVGATAGPGALAPGGGGAGSPVDAGSLAPAGPDTSVAGVRPVPEEPAAAGAEGLPAGAGAAGRPAPLTNPVARTSDSDLLAAVDAETAKNEAAVRKNAVKSNENAITAANLFLDKSNGQLQAAQAVGDHDMARVAQQNISTARGRIAALTNERAALVSQPETTNEQRAGDDGQAGVRSEAVAASEGGSVQGAGGPVEGRDRVEAPAVDDRSERAGRAAEVNDLEPARVQQVLRRIENARLKGGEALKLEQAPPAGRGVGLAQKLARVFGMPTVFVRVKSGKASFIAANVDGVNVLRADHKELPLAATAHEVVHSLPDDIKAKLIAAVKPTFRNVDRFKKEFGYSDEKADEELTAVLAQQHAKTPEFWRDLRAKLGDGDFAKLADHILAKLDGLLKGFKKEDLGEFTTDVAAVRAAVASAYAETAVRRGTATAVDEGAQLADTSPTDAQKEAGNYKVGRARIAGRNISIENPEGSTRSGTDGDGKTWRTTMKDHYGYIRGTVGRDKDHVDIFVKPGTAEDWSGPMFVVDQADPRTGEFDEHKIIAGAKDEAEARDIYARNYGKGWEGLKSITEMTQDTFNDWLDSGDTTMPADPAFSQQRADFKDPEERTEVSTTKPTAKAGGNNSYDQKWVINADDIKSSAKHVEAVVKALKTYNTLSGKGNAAELMQELHDTVVENLLWLHDLVPAGVRARAKLWYDGANKIAGDWTRKYGISERQASGVLAVLSPQMDWFKNVSLAERVITTWKERQNEPWSQAMTDWVQSWVNASDTAEMKEARSKVLEDAGRLQGKALYELEGLDAAKFVRVFDETYNERRHRLVTPEGGFGDYVTKSDDGDSSVTWGGFGTIAKAIDILNDGSFRNVEAKLGGEHKVRNFFNNIAAPNSADGHVTIDTHAVAAALVKALSGTTKEVTDNFGAAGGNAATGAGGTYGLFADAYRDAAAQRGVLAREMQSITWEAVRSLFPAAIKDKLAPQVDAVWDRFKKGELTRDQARKEVFTLSGGIRPMAWEGGDTGKSAADGGTSYKTELDADPAKRAGRLLPPVDAKDKIQVSLSASTSTIPGLAELQARVEKGDGYAHQLLQDIALDSLRHLLGGTSAKIKADRATGLYGGGVEPSLGLSITFTDGDRKAVLAGLAKFGENFNQEQIHVRGGSKYKAGHDFGDGSYATPVIRWPLKKALDRKQIQKIIDKSGLYGLTFGDDFVEAYYVGDPADEEGRAGFDESIATADRLLGQAAEGARREVARLWAYGHGDSAIGYDRIRGDVAAGPATESDTARRVAEYLNQADGKPGKVKTFAQAAELTPDQAKLQRKIAAVYESLPDNDLKNPRVKRAYQELAKEVVRQYKALPIKVEVFEGRGEPYKNSTAMRRDVLDNNHLFIYGTTPETYGPEGADFSGHPLLGDSGQKDAGGKPLLFNDLLRAVHDYFAHNLSATQFGPRGEEAAWKNHMASTSNPWARWALTSETRGQNSWVNFNPAAEGVAVKDRPFARQKVALLPLEYSFTGDRAVDAPMKQFAAATPVSQQIGSKPERDVDFSEERAPRDAALSKWFGNSKVADADGTPRVVYTGTSKDTDFSTFKAPKNGIWFTTDSKSASDYARENDSKGFEYEGGKYHETNTADRVMPVYLRIENPKVYEQWPDKIRVASNYKRAQGEVFEQLRQEGYDGVNIGDVWVAFRPEQVKSAIGNRGTFDASKSRIDFANKRKPASQAYGNQLNQAMGFPVPEEGRWHAMRRIAQDYFLRVKTVQDAVIQGGGAVDERRDVYRAEERMYGRVQSQLDDFAKGWVEPMLAKAAKDGIDLDELALYAYAKHAPERNAHIDTINPGLAGKGSGMTDRDAAAVVAAIPAGKLKAFEDLRQDLLAITETTRRTLLQEGLITQDEHDAWSQQYQDYVPLRGFDVVNDDTGAVRPGSGRGFNIRGKESLKAMGRASRAGDIIENIVRDYQRAVIRAERNAVGKVFLDLATTNPDANLWEVNAAAVKRSQNRLTGLVSTTMEADKGPDTVSVKVGGREVYITIHDPLLLRAMRKAAVDESGQMQRALATSLGAYNNWMRNTLTRYNPVFGVTNAFKDAQTGAVTSFDVLGGAGAAKYAGYYRAAMAASFRNETGSLGKTGQFWGDPAMDKAFEEFKAAGGTTGGWYLRDPAEIEADLRQLMVAAGAAPRSRKEKITGSKAFQGAKAALKYVEIFGAASENASRIAAYRAARDLGRSPADAASIAKNLTTNFNRKGEWGTGLNALYLFFNASVQGSARVLQALKNPKVMALMAGVTAVSAGLAALGASMGGSDDDGESYWDKIPAFEKERSFIIMLPPGVKVDGAKTVGKQGRYLKIPMPYGFNVFPVLGYQMADVARWTADHNHGASPAKAAIRMVSAVAGSYNPMGGSFDVTDPTQVAMAAAPTAVDAGIQLAAGVNSFGTRVGPAKGRDETKPDAETFTPSQAGTPSQKLARWLNDHTGGNEARSGAIDVMPGTIDNAVRLATGGVGVFLKDVFINMPTKLVDPEATTRARDVPFLRNVFGQVDETVERGIYYDRIKEVSDEAKTALNEMKMGIDVKYDERSRGLQTIGKVAESYTKLMTGLRKEELRVVDDPDLSAAQKKTERRDIEERRNEFVRQFNSIYVDAMKDVNAGRFKE